MITANDKYNCEKILAFHYQRPSTLLHSRQMPVPRSICACECFGLLARPKTQYFSLNAYNNPKKHTFPCYFCVSEGLVRTGCYIYVRIINLRTFHFAPKHGVNWRPWEQNVTSCQWSISHKTQFYKDVSSNSPLLWEINYFSS